MKKDQTGFGVIVIVLIVVAVLAVGATGALVYRSKHQNTSGYDQNACPPGTVKGTPPLPNSSKETCLVPGAAYEPVIYLYPPKQEKVNVGLSYPAGLSKSVPAYDEGSGWSVIARPDGTLTDIASGKDFPYLLWEGKPAPFNFDMTKGVVVAGSQTKTFFEKQLPAIGLNKKETDAFIAYWLPKLQGNRYNLIHFAGTGYTDYAKLTVTPRPESLLRVFMAFEPLENPVKVSPQSFPPFHRTGFTVVEWGGTELQK